MADAKREISGFFLSAHKFASHVAALARPDCATTQLRLFHNEPEHTAAVLDSLRYNASLTCLDIFELDAASAATLADLLSSATCLRLASLAVHHPHDSDAVASLCRGIAASPWLSRLHLAHLDPRGIAALADALLAWGQATGGSSAAATVPRLKRLRLEKCVFSPPTAVALAAALGRQAGALSELEVVESDLGDAAAEALAGAPGWLALAEPSSSVDRLDLSSCHIGPRGAAQLGRFLAASGGLRSLFLGNNGSIGCEGAKALAAGLALNRSLHRLDLTACGVGAVGAAALAAALAPDCDGDDGGAPLQHLALGGNAVSAAGLAALLRALSDNSPRPCALRTLQLDHNRVRGGELMQALGLTPPAAASKTPLPSLTAPLEQLSLAGNALYDIGLDALTKCLAAAPCLELLDLRENGISDAGVAALLPLIAPHGGGAAAAAVGSCGLKGLLLDGNRLHNAGAQALLEAVTAAPGLWRFSAEANKMTDPALRLSLAQLSQLRAARHSQWAVLGRLYSSSSSSEDGGGGGGGGSNRGSGGGAAGGRGSAGGESRRSDEAASLMDLEGGKPAAAGGKGDNRVAPPPPQQLLPLQRHLQHKHRLEEVDAVEGEGIGSGDESRRRPARNVAARGAGECAAGHGCGGGDGQICQSAAAPLPQQQQLATDAWRCTLPPADTTRRTVAGAEVWCGARAFIDREGGGAARDRSSSGGGGGSSSDGGASCADVPMHDSTPACGSGAAAASTAAGALRGSPPPAMCHVMAMTGVGGAASVGVSGQRGSGIGASCGSGPHPVAAVVVRPAPQQVLPACRRPRYKPLTLEQQRLFEDF